MGLLNRATESIRCSFRDSLLADKALFPSRLKRIILWGVMVAGMLIVAVASSSLIKLAGIGICLLSLGRWVNRAERYICDKEGGIKV